MVLFKKNRELALSPVPPPEVPDLQHNILSEPLYWPVVALIHQLIVRCRNHNCVRTLIRQLLEFFEKGTPRHGLAFHYHVRQTLLVQKQRDAISNAMVPTMNDEHLLHLGP